MVEGWGELADLFGCGKVYVVVVHHFQFGSLLV